jgi:hypothetical protein
MTDSGQLDLVALLMDQASGADSSLTDLEETLSAQIDANPNDKLLMETFDLVTDARQSLQTARDLLVTMERRDIEELP